MRLVQITDCHLHADPAARSRTGLPYPRLLKVVEAAARLRPDFVLVTGDVSQDESAASYALAAHAFDRFDCPWSWLPGNHDVPELMAECRPFDEVLELGGWRLLLLNTQLSGQPQGQLGEVRLTALAQRLEEDDQPTLVAMHHPPIGVGSHWMDELGLVDAEALWRVLSKHERIEAIFCGHIHQDFTGYRAMPHGEVPVYGCPSTSDQFLPGAETFAVDQEASSGFRVIELGEGIMTWVERVTD